MAWWKDMFGNQSASKEEPAPEVPVQEEPVATKVIPVEPEAVPQEEGADAEGEKPPVHIDFHDERAKTVEELDSLALLEQFPQLRAKELKYAGYTKDKQLRFEARVIGGETELVNKLQRELQYLYQVQRVNHEIIIKSRDESGSDFSHLLKALNLLPNVDAAKLANGKLSDDAEIPLIKNGHDVYWSLPQVAATSIPHAEELFRRANLESIELKHFPALNKFTIALHLGKDTDTKKLGEAVDAIKEYMPGLYFVERKVNDTGRNVEISSTTTDPVGGALALLKALKINIDDPNLKINGRDPKQRVERVVVVGGGMTGMRTATKLAEKSTHPQVVYLVKPKNEPWGGLAYGRADTHDMTYEEPTEKFKDWAKGVARQGWEFDEALAPLNWKPEQLEADYNSEAPAHRQNIGRYLYHEMLMQKLYAPNVSIRYEEGKVTGLQQMGEKPYFQLDDGSKIFYDQAFVATGNKVKPVEVIEKALPQVEMSFASDAYVRNIYDDGARERMRTAMPEKGTAFILGTKSEGIEAALKLLDDGKAARIVMLSKSGKLTDPNGTPIAPMDFKQHAHDFSKIGNLFERSYGYISWTTRGRQNMDNEVDKAIEYFSFHHYRFDNLPELITSAIETNLGVKIWSENEKNQVEHLVKERVKRYKKEHPSDLGIYDPKVNPESYARIQEAIESGKIQLIKGSLDFIRPSGGSTLSVSYTSEGENRPRHLNADLFVQASGYTVGQPNEFGKDTRALYLKERKRMPYMEHIEADTTRSVDTIIKQHSIKPDSLRRESALHYEWGKAPGVKRTYLVEELEQAALPEDSIYHANVKEFIHCLNSVQEITLKEFDIQDYQKALDQYHGAADGNQKGKGQSLEDAVCTGAYLTNKTLNMLGSLPRFLGNADKQALVLKALNDSVTDLNYLAGSTQIDIPNSVAEYCKEKKSNPAILKADGSADENILQFHVPKEEKDYGGYFNRMYEMEKRYEYGFDLSDTEKVSLVSGNLSKYDKLELVNIALDQGNIETLGDYLDQDALKAIIDTKLEDYAQRMTMVWSDVVRQTVPILSNMYKEQVKPQLAEGSENAKLGAEIEEKLESLANQLNGKVKNGKKTEIAPEQEIAR